MGTINVKKHEAKKTHIMMKCFECYAEHGLSSVGIKGLAEACGISSGHLYAYFENLDDLIIQSTEYCMSRVEEELKYRLMYQIYTHPKYRAYGQEFFEGVNLRYTEYAKQLEDKLGIPYQKLTGLIYMLVRASVHYALFEDEFYLKSQIAVLKESIELLTEKHHSGVQLAESGADT